MTDVVKGIHDKIVRRHPHVFGDVQLDDVDGVLANWEKLKEKEREKREQCRREEEGKGVLDGVPAILPALIQAQEYQDRAARVGFDWPEIEGVLDKVREEIEEIKQAENQEQVCGGIGRPVLCAGQSGALEESGRRVRVAGDESEIQEALWVCGAGREGAGTEFIRYDAGGDGRVVERGEGGWDVDLPRSGLGTLSLTKDAPFYHIFSRARILCHAVVCGFGITLAGRGGCLSNR